MILFIAICVLMSLIAGAVTVIPLLKKEEYQPLSRKELNITLYKKKLVELENDLKDMVISSEQYEIAKTELSRGMLYDTSDDSVCKKSNNKSYAIAVIIVVLLPILAGILYYIFGTPELLK